MGRMYENVSLDYIAGFFDGEGSVGIKVSRDSKRKYAYFFGGRIAITQKDRTILDAIQKTLGFGVVTMKGDGCYRLTINSENDCLRFIELMENRVLLKREQLRLLKEFYKYRKKCRDWHFSKESTLALLNLAERMQILNNGKVTKHLLKVKEHVVNFNEEEYNKRMNKVRAEKVERLKKLPPMRKNIPKDELVDLYVNKKLSCCKIAKIFNVHPCTIRRRLEEYGIPRRKPPLDLLMYRGLI